MSQPAETNVDPVALETFSNRTRALADRFDRLADRMDGVSVGSLSFGQLPMSRQLHEAYDTIAEACRAGLADAFTAMQDIASEVRLSAEHYDATEVGNRDLFRSDGGPR